MKAVVWHGKHDVRVDTVPDPQILNPQDAIVRVTLSAICGSDLHLYDGLIPTMKAGDILGHEFVGEIVEVGSAVTNLSAGDRVITEGLIRIKPGQLVRPVPAGSPLPKPASNGGATAGH